MTSRTSRLSWKFARSGKKVPDDQLPGRAMGEDILDRLEAGSVIAEPLAEIVSCKDEEKVRSKGALEPLLSIAEDGTVRRRARRVKGVHATTFEVPRKKYVITANAWTWCACAVDLGMPLRDMTLLLPLPCQLVAGARCC